MEDRQFNSVKKVYLNSKNKKNMMLITLFIASLVVLFYSLTIGTAKMSLSDFFKILLGKFIDRIDTSTINDYELNSYIIFSVRLPRILLAFLAGFSLGGAGVVMQGIFRNPLASPFTLGVSNGAAFGAAMAIVLGTSIFKFKVQSFPVLIAVNAFIFGCVSLFLVYLIGRIKVGSTTVLLLAGVAVGSLFSAGVSVLKYFSSNEALRDLDTWLMGGFWGANYKNITLLFPLIAICTIILIKISWDLNALLSGEEVALTLGIDVKKIVVISLLIVTLMASGVIAFTGVIGFIGLVAPHISRSFIGTDNRYLIPCSCLLGGILLLISDTIGRTIISPIEIPVGIITSLIGAPFFIYILIKKDSISYE